MKQYFVIMALSLISAAGFSQSQTVAKTETTVQNKTTVTTSTSATASETATATTSDKKKKVRRERVHKECSRMKS